MKKDFIIGVIITAVTLSVVIFILNTSFVNRIDTRINASNLEYRVDTQPIFDRFPALPLFQECLWKADTIGRTNFGPTNYWMKGFIILDKASYTLLLNEFSWDSVDLKFSKGIDPTETGFENFNWCYNEEFDTKVTTMSFVGSFYFDKINGVLYFSLVNS